MRKNTDFIVVHCSATPPYADIGATEIRRWHMEERGWSDIGYAEVIRRNGTYEEGRNLDDDTPAANEIGAHAYGYNHRSVSVCLVGGIDSKGNPENNFTPEQFETLRRSLRFYKVLFPEAKIVGHNELNPKKDCPCFDVQQFVAENGL